MAAILLFALLLSLTGCGHDEYAESDMLPAYLVSVTAGEANGSGILYQKDQHWLYVLTGGSAFPRWMGNLRQQYQRFRYDGYRPDTDPIG